MDNARTEILEGLNVFRALEAWGATLYAAWATDEPDVRLRVATRDAQRMAGCQQALARGVEAAKATDPATHHFLSQLYSEEKVSGAWYRHTYSEVTGKRPCTDALPVLAPDQVVRRAD